MMPTDTLGVNAMTVSVEDRLAIGDLFARYMWAIDTGDVEGLVACFTEDGALENSRRWPLRRP